MAGILLPAACCCGPTDCRDNPCSYPSTVTISATNTEGSQNITKSATLDLTTCRWDTGVFDEIEFYNVDGNYFYCNQMVVYFRASGDYAPVEPYLTMFGRTGPPDGAGSQSAFPSVPPVEGCVTFPYGFTGEGQVVFDVFPIEVSITT